MKLFIKKIVSCTDCHSLIHKVDAQYVGWGEYYCGKCKKPYDEKRIFSSYWGACTEVKYSKNMEVDINGEPIGYKKVK